MSVTEEIKDKASDLTEILELRLAAQQGYVRSQFTLAVKLAKGDGVDRDLDEAVKWYQKALRRNP
jgi:TPR repeat protein